MKLNRLAGKGMEEATVVSLKKCLCNGVKELRKALRR
jgi:hypothetical protein